MDESSVTTASSRSTNSKNAYSAPTAAMEAAVQFLVQSRDVVYGLEAIEAQYKYQTTRVRSKGGVLEVHLKSTHFTFRPARPACAQATGHACRLRWEQRFHAHRRGAGPRAGVARGPTTTVHCLRWAP